MSDETEAQDQEPTDDQSEAPPAPEPIAPTESPDAKAVREHRERLEEADRKRGW